MASLVEIGPLTVVGQTRATQYILSPANQLFGIIDIAIYFEKEIDERKIKEGFNFQLITDVFRDVDLFTADEANHLQLLQEEFLNNLSHMTSTAYDKGMERLAID